MKDGIKRGGRKEGRKEGTETEGRRVVGKGRKGKRENIFILLSLVRRAEKQRKGKPSKCSRGGGGGIRGKMGGWRKDEILCMLKKEKLN